MNTMIKCLPKEVQAKLRSGIALPSLQQCVEELILNSIDAQATCVGVRMDTEALRVQVIDNGVGMSAEDMGCVGNRYHTSKCSSVEDLDNLSWYGFRGEALASIVSLATLVELSSRTRSSVKTHSKIFKDGKGMGVFEADTSRPSAGTTVTICNFFHNMPVRRKRVDAVLEGERIRHRVEAISLMHPSVSFTLKNDGTGAVLVQLPKARSTYHRFAQIHSLGRAQRLGEINHARGQFEVIGHVGREGHYNNSLQFLYVNQRLLVKTRIHKLLNFLLRRLCGLNPKIVSPELHSAVRSPKKHKRSQELNGVYVINIKCSYSEYDICLEPAKTLIEFKDWDGILLCVEEAVKAFVRRENLEALVSQDDLDHVSPKSLGIHITDKEGHDGGSCGQGTSSSSTLDCSIGMRLASHPVHRKHKDTHASEDSQDVITERKEETEQDKITANESEKTRSEESMSKECSDEPLCDLARMEPASDNHEEEGTPFIKAEEGSKRLCISSSVGQLEGENLECSKERESMCDDAASPSNVTSPDNVAQQIHPGSNCIEQILPDDHGTGHRQATGSNGKIGLSDPYIHESLQTPDPFQIDKQLLLAQKSEGRHFASKRKISLDAGHDRPSQELCKDLASVVPSKMPRIPTCPKVSLRKEFGSLEEFRRKYGKSGELKAPSQESRQECNAGPQTDGFVLNSHRFLICQKDQRGCDLTDKEKTRGGLRSPPTVAIFTSLKSEPAQNKGQRSLAAKLSHFKQHRADYKVLPHLSRTISQHNTCVSGSNNGSQDNSNKKNHTAPNPQTVRARSTNPPPVEGEACTASGDWLHHYDTSVGKTVYVNKVTGLSRYEDVPVDDTEVRCTSDVTNMAVSVVSEMGELELFLCSSAGYVDVMLTGDVVQN